MTSKNVKEFIKQVFVTEDVREGRARRLRLNDFETLDGFCERYSLKSVNNIFDEAAETGVNLGENGKELDSGDLLTKNEL
jgi:hypothetical protein